MNIKHNRKCCFTLNDFLYFKKRFPNFPTSLLEVTMTEKDGYFYFDIESLYYRLHDEYFEAAKVLLNQQVTKPEDCIFAIGIPTEEFNQPIFYDEFRRIRSDYVQLHKNFIMYDSSVIKPLRYFIRQLISLKVNVKEDVTIHDFSDLFDRYSIIMLYTHSIRVEHGSIYNRADKNGFELGKEFVSLDRIIDAIPPNFTGVLNFCFNTDRGFIREIHINRPDCIAGDIASIRCPQSHLLLFLRIFFTILKEKNLTYQYAQIEACIQSIKIIETNKK